MLDFNSPERLSVLNAPIDAVDMTGALDFVDRYIATAEKPGYVLAVNPEKVFALRENPFLKDFFQAATLLIPDGIGMVYALRLLAGRVVARVPGADLMQNLCAQSAGKGHRIFIYGAKEEVNAQACAILAERYPGIHIAGRANGYVAAAEMPQLIDTINASAAEILFVALGSPKQEEWIQQHLPALKVKIVQGIGGTLDTITGHVKRAPLFWQRLGLEWFYRLLSQPSRAGRQLRLVTFVLEVLQTKIKKTGRGRQGKGRSEA